MKNFYIYKKLINFLKLIIYKGNTELPNKAEKTKSFCKLVSAVITLLIFFISSILALNIFNCFSFNSSLLFCK